MMFKNLVRVLMIGAMGAALSGCNDFGSATGVVGTAGSALKKNDAKLFYQTLDGQAQQEWGNAKGMARLKDYFSRYSKFGAKQEGYISGGAFEDNVQRVSILGDSQRVARATVACQVTQQPGTSMPGPCSHQTGCSPGGPGLPTYTSYCLITDISLL